LGVEQVCAPCDDFLTNNQLRSSSSEVLKFPSAGSLVGVAPTWRPITKSHIKQSGNPASCQRGHDFMFPRIPCWLLAIPSLVLSMLIAAAQDKDSPPSEPAKAAPLV